MYKLPRDAPVELCISFWQSTRSNDVSNQAAWEFHRSTGQRQGPELPRFLTVVPSSRQPAGSAVASGLRFATELVSSKGASAHGFLRFQIYKLFYSHIAVGFGRNGTPGVWLSHTPWLYFIIGTFCIHSCHETEVITIQIHMLHCKFCLYRKLPLPAYSKVSINRAPVTSNAIVKPQGMLHDGPTMLYILAGKFVWLTVALGWFLVWLWNFQWTIWEWNMGVWWSPGFWITEKNQVYPCIM